MLRNIVASIKMISETTAEEAKQFMEWMWKFRWKTHFTPAVMDHPRMTIMKASDETGDLLYLPLQTCLMFDCLAPRPGLNRAEMSLSFQKINELLEKGMTATGICDAYFYTEDGEFADKVATHKGVGWEEVRNVRLLRKRIAPPVLPELAKNGA